MGEQRAIARALADVDALSIRLEILIEKKRAIQEGAMRLLLEGEKRLDGFRGEWQELSLGEVAEIRKGQLLSASTMVSGDVPVIAAGLEPAGFHWLPNRHTRTVTVSASRANAGHVLFHDRPIFATDCSTIEESTRYDLSVSTTRFGCGKPRSVGCRSVVPSRTFTRNS